MAWLKIVVSQKKTLMTEVGIFLIYYMITFFGGGISKVVREMIV
jgi:hypothetical protein